MPELFEGTQLPKWMMPSTFLLESEQAAEGIGRTFASSFAGAANRSEEKRQFDAKAKVAASKIAKLASIASQLEGVTSAEAALDLTSKNPQWLADPDTAPLVKNYIGLQGKIASAELNSIQGKTKLADMSAFVKGMAEIDPEDRAMIQSMSRNPDGSYSGEQWKALSMAKERVNIRRKNEAEAAALEAQARGDIQTTTITDKGVTTRFSPKPDTTAKDATIINVLGNAKKWREQAAATKDFAEAELLLGYAESAEKWADKQGKFAPPDPGFVENTVRTDSRGRKETTEKKREPLPGSDPDSKPKSEDVTQTLKPISTKQEFDALPSGAEFIGADGKRYKKP